MQFLKNKITKLVKNIVFFAKDNPTRFGVVWLVIFLIFFGVFSGLGWVPSELDGDDNNKNEDDDAPLVFAGPNNVRIPIARADESKPIRIIIDSVDIDTQIENPTSRDIMVLDEALLGGAVHYPGSGNLDDESNMFLFGHSSYLPSVINEAYQAFNGLQDLESGEIIRVQSSDKEYIYKVRKVELVNADDAWVELSSGEKRLTLSTCNTFGKKQDRFVVTADFVGSFALEA